jgi:hypothetical protein
VLLFSPVTNAFSAKAVPTNPLMQSSIAKYTVKKIPPIDLIAISSFCQWVQGK